MRYATLGIGAAFTILAATLIGLTVLVPAPAVNDMISPKRITFVFTGLLALFGLLLTRRGLREVRTNRGSGPKTGGRWADCRVFIFADCRVFIFMALCVLYAAALSTLGHFLPCTFVLILTTLLLLRVGRGRAAAIALIFSLTVFAVFKTLLGVPLP